jgi:protocatechuate 3,4-dioxygenase beta subunit
MRPLIDDLSGWIRAHALMLVTGIVVGTVLGLTWLVNTKPEQRPSAVTATSDAPSATGSRANIADSPTSQDTAGSRASRHHVSDAVTTEPVSQIQYRISDDGYVDAYVANWNPGGSLNVSPGLEEGTPWDPDTESETADGRDADATSETDADSDRAAEDPAPEELQRNQKIEGRVVDEYGMPVPGIGLIATAARLFNVPPGAPVEKSDFIRDAVSDGNGEFFFGQLAAGDYDIRTLALQGYATAQTTVRAGAGFADILLQSQREVRVSGQVASIEGEPLAGVLVAPKVLGASGTHTDGYGRFSLQLPLRYDTGFDVHAQADGYKNAVLSVPERQASNGDISLDITLKPIGSVAPVIGVVTDTTGQALSGKRVRLSSPTSGQSYTTDTDYRGDFLFFSVEGADDYQLKVYADRYHEEALREGVEVGAEGLILSVSVLARETGTLSGQIRTVTGNPVPNFAMVLKSRNQIGRGIAVSADGAGNYVVPNAPTGDLVMETGSAPRFVVSGIRMSPGADVHAPVVLDWGNERLQGRVIDPDGNPVSGETVAMTWAYSANGVTSSASRQAVSDAQGYFRFEKLGPGNRTIMVDATGFKPARVHHDISTDGSDVLLRLEHRDITVGMVSD